MTVPSSKPLSESKLPDSEVNTTLRNYDWQIENQLVGIIAIILSIIGPFLVALGYLLQNDTGFYLGFHGVLYGPIFSGVATLLGLLALPGRYARRALCICGIWWAWWIYAVTQWSWTI